MQIDNNDYEDFDVSEAYDFSLVQRSVDADEVTRRRSQAKEAFKDYEFLSEQGLPQPAATYAEKTEALNIFLDQPNAPPAPTTPGAAKALDRLLKRFDYTLANSSNKMRQYVLFKLFELAENEDPRLQIKAVEMLGKVSEIGLFTNKTEVATTDKPTGDLESELNELMSTYSIGGELGAIDVPYEQISDEELKGNAVEEEFEEVDEVEDE